MLFVHFLSAPSIKTLTAMTLHGEFRSAGCFPSCVYVLFYYFIWHSKPSIIHLCSATLTETTFNWVKISIWTYFSTNFIFHFSSGETFSQKVEKTRTLPQLGTKPVSEHSALLFIGEMCHRSFTRDWTDLFFFFWQRAQISKHFSS